VPPPTIEEILVVETGRGLLMREKPAGIASKSSAAVVLGDIQVSLRAKRLLCRRYKPINFDSMCILILIERGR
jgi:hypothetical protein